MAEQEATSRRDVFAGAMFIAIAAVFFIQGVQYEFGTALQMGPGFLPVTLAIVLGIFGASILISGLRKNPVQADGPIPWRPMLLTCLALAIFGAGARPLGLVPVVAVCTFLTAIASSRNSVLSSAVMAVVMSALCYVVFKVGLGVALPVFGPWAFGR